MDCRWNTFRFQKSEHWFKETKWGRLMIRNNSEAYCWITRKIYSNHMFFPLITIMHSEMSSPQCFLSNIITSSFILLAFASIDTQEQPNDDLVSSLLFHFFDYI